MLSYRITDAYCAFLAQKHSVSVAAQTLIRRIYFKGTDPIAACKCRFIY